MVLLKRLTRVWLIFFSWYVSVFLPSQNAVQGQFYGGDSARIETHVQQMQKKKNTQPRRHSPNWAPQTPSNQLNPVE